MAKTLEECARACRGNITDYSNCVALLSESERKKGDSFEVFRRRYPTSSTSRPTSGGVDTDLFGKNLFETLTKGGSLLVDAALAVAKKQIGQTDSLRSPELLLDMGINLSQGNYTQFFNQFGGELLDQYEQQSKLLSDVNSKTSLTGKLSEAVREDIKLASIYAASFGYNMEDVGEIFTNLIEDTGRYALINRETMEMAAPISRAYGMTIKDTTDAIVGFEKVGIGSRQTLRSIDEAARRSMELGLNGVKVSSELRTNIGKLNEMRFQNGVEGLERMIQKSIEFRSSMEGVQRIVEKVMDPEGAIDFSANLQVLGAAFGDFNDPLKLMYMSVNNVEGLQDALIGAAGSLATFNSEQGKFEVASVNFRKANEIAKLTGINIKEINEMAIASAERAQAKSDLLLKNFNLGDKQMEFLTNLARMEDGKMTIQIPQSIADKLTGDLKGATRVTLEQLSKTNAEILLDNQEAFEKLSPEKIANAQLTATQQLMRDTAYIVAYLKYQTAKQLDTSLVGGAASTVLDMLKKGVDYFTPKVETGMKVTIPIIGTEIGLDGVGRTQRGQQTIPTGNVSQISDEQFITLANKFEELYRGTKSETSAREFAQVLEHNVNIHATADGVMDAMTQYLLQHPNFKEQFQNDELVRSFLSNPSKTK